jgi:putative phage-type endonuclease
MQAQILFDVEQQSEQWFALRKTKLTATDANVLMSKEGSYFGKTPTTLYNDKTSDAPPKSPNEAMQRGSRLEPIARELFEVQTGIKMEPQVVVKDWAMASLDGMNHTGDLILEIKCPGPKDHAVALNGKVPDHYYPQLQFQMYVTDLDEVFYYSFDGFDGCLIVVKRDEEYIANMIQVCKKFYDCLVNRIPPESPQDDYLNMEDEEMWAYHLTRYKKICKDIEELEADKKAIKDSMRFLSGEVNAKGNGATLSLVTVKGRIKYEKIPELIEVDLEKYREPSRTEWRLTCR